MQHPYRKILAENGDHVNFDDSTRCGMVLHSHGSSGAIHFHKEFTQAGTFRYILVDADDILNWPHDVAGYTHFDAFDIQTDPGISAAYAINLWWLENVSATHSNRYMLWSTSGRKATTQIKEIFQRWTPVGMKCHTGRFLSNMHVIGDPLINSAALLDTVRYGSPSAPQAYPGEHDVILEVVIQTASIWLDLNCAYHTHDPADTEH